MNLALYGQSLAYGNTDGTIGLSATEISGIANSYLSENNANEVAYAGLVKVNYTTWWSVEVPITSRLLVKGYTSVGFAKVAHGGRDINWFMKGDASGTYDDFMTCITNVQTNDGQPIKYLIWIHGSADASNQTKADAYQANLTQLFSDIRSDTNTDLNIIVVGMNDQTSSPYVYRSTIIAAQKAYCTGDAKAVYVDTFDQGLHHKGNDPTDIHLSSYGNVMLGQRILLTLTEKK